MCALRTLQEARRYVETCDPPGDLLARYDRAIRAMDALTQALGDVAERYPNNVGMSRAREALKLAKARGQ